MSNVEFFGQIKLQPFKSLAKLEQIMLAKLKTTGKLAPEPKPEITREPFYDQQCSETKISAL